MLDFVPGLQPRDIRLKIVDEVLDHLLVRVYECQVVLARVYLRYHASQSIPLTGVLQVLVLHL